MNELETLRSDITDRRALLRLLLQREDARAAKDFEGADHIRDGLLQLGLVVEDGPSGVRVFCRTDPWHLVVG